jgi:predicted 3-demethylubiquinone-9 3-methyltransferase (glyoxalase superfamily)
VLAANGSSVLFARLTQGEPTVWSRGLIEIDLYRPDNSGGGLSDSSVGAVYHAPGDFPSGKKGDVLTVEFTVMGIPCLGLNCGPAFKHNEAFSFRVATADQAETDRYWNAIVSNGGTESACGWCKDKWGLSWQITRIALIQAITDPDPAVAKRAFDAMMQMRKIDIAAIEAARRG